MIKTQSLTRKVDFTIELLLYSSQGSIQAELYFNNNLLFYSLNQEKQNLQGTLQRQLKSTSVCKTLIYIYKS